MSIPIKINGKHLYKIMLSATEIASWVATLGKAENLWTDTDIDTVSIQSQLYPTEIMLTSETYSRDAKRNANYDMQDFDVINRKAKPEITWEMLQATYVQRLMSELSYSYSIAVGGEAAPTISITYKDFVGERTISTYLGQTIEGTLTSYNNVLYWENLRIAFPER